MHAARAWLLLKVQGGRTAFARKKHKDTFLLLFFSLVRKERKGQKEESIPLLNSFRRLAATSANKVPRPSSNCLAAAIGSKRSSADSDLLLCHVGLWQTSRELTDSRKRTRSASPRQGGRFLVLIPESPCADEIKQNFHFSAGWHRPLPCKHNRISNKQKRSF